MTGLQHKVVLITGASGGIGQSLAAEFSRAGTTVVISSRNEEKLRTLAEQLRRDGGQTLPLRCDVAEREQVYALCAMIAKQVGTVQILINSAGIGPVMV
jgi:NAD(P)-dependent dehydrogenase (short-subunit alcohol dehydrogenase family)